MPRTVEPVDRKKQEGGTNGLYVRGAVVRRSKKFVGADEAEIVSYGVMLDNAVVDVDDWRPEGYFDIGEFVELRVEVRAFTTKAGRVCVNLQRDRGAKGAF